MRIACLCFVLCLIACNASTQYNYEPMKRRLTPNTSLPVIAVAPFVNARTPLKKAPKRRFEPSISFYKDENDKFFGLTHKGERYTALEVILRDLFFDELGKAQARPVMIESDATPEGQRGAAQAAGAAYWLATEVKGFSILRKPPSKLLGLLLNRVPLINALINQGTARYVVNLRLSLYRVSDGALVWNENLETDRVALPNPGGRGPYPLMFAEILPEHFLRGSNSVVGQAERDLELSKQKAAAPPPKEVVAPAPVEATEDAPAPSAPAKKKPRKSSSPRANP